MKKPKLLTIIALMIPFLYLLYIVIQLEGDRKMREEAKRNEGLWYPMSDAEHDSIEFGINPPKY